MLVFYIFDRKRRTEKVDIGNADIGLRKEMCKHGRSSPFALRMTEK